MDAWPGYDAWQDKVLAALVSTTRTVNRLAADDLPFQKTVNPAVGEELDEKTERLLRLTSALLQSAAKTTSGQTAPKLSDADDVDVFWPDIVDVVDTLLEKADTALDEVAGAAKRKEVPQPAESVSVSGARPDAAAAAAAAQPRLLPQQQPPQPVVSPQNGSNQGVRQGLATKKRRQGERLDWSLMRANIIKPQASFERKPDNFADPPWKPLLSRKPHAAVPLEESLVGAPASDGTQQKQYDYLFYLPHLVSREEHMAGTSLDAAADETPDSRRRRIQRRVKRKRRELRDLGSAKGDADGKSRYKHPYETEILRLKYPKAVYQDRPPIRFSDLESSAATWVDTFEGVLAMLEELKQAHEIAVDIEHHDYRTYLGLLSLMQISTRDKDWIVDTLKPWRHRLEILNDVFADPHKVKVFHGSSMDIIWLQRDLGLYVVGLFDTFHACESLQYPKKSLAALLDKFVGFDADKKYQMADWRIRPLPEQMFFYARSDTHFLLFIYDMLRNELVKGSDQRNPNKNLIEWTLQRSKETSLSRYESVPYDAEKGQGPRGWFNALSKPPYLPKSEQFAVYQAVHQWRDTMARQMDESPPFIMPQNALFEIARAMPSDVQELGALMYTVPFAAKSESAALLELIREAKARGTDGPTYTQFVGSESARTRDAEADGSSSAADRAPGRGNEAPTDTKSDRSRLWGSLPVSSLWEGAPRGVQVQRGEGMMPITIPSWLASKMAGPARDNEQQQPNHPRTAKLAQDEDGLSTAAETAAVAAAAEDEAVERFTLRMGRSLKIKETERAVAKQLEPESESASGMSPDEMSGVEMTQSPSTSGAEANAAQAKKTRRRWARGDRSRQQQQRATEGSGKQANEEREGDEYEEPFDYSQATSVLHAQRATAAAAASGKGGADGKKAFKPYQAKTMADGPKGERRMHLERDGKTATFKK